MPPPPTPRPGRTTLTDVARLAGVSIATASKALNGRYPVSPATRDRVRVAADQLAFTPHVAARGVSVGRTGTIGLLTDDLEGRFSIPVLMGAEDAAGQDSVSVFLCDARGDSGREQHHIRALLARQVDGLLVVGSRNDPRPPLRGRLPVPVVYAYAPSTSPRDMSVIPDNVGAGRTAVEHLIGIGRQRIAHITGDLTYTATHDRARGAWGAVRDAGLSLVGGRVFGGAWNESWGRTAAAALLALHPDLDALFCGSDQLARGAMDSLRERGRTVPGDVAVVGFDNWDVLTIHARPQLTSIDVRLEQIGRLAAQRLFAAMDGRPEPGVTSVDCTLIARESTLA